VDVVYFLKERTNFIRFYYDQSVVPFAEIKHQIENELPPFDDPPYSEDPEPPYLDKWIEANTGIELVGMTCVSMLSDSLKQYFGSLQHRVICFRFPNRKKSFKQGFVAAYKGILGDILDTDWSGCPADFDIIEQVVLARNRGQHGSDLRTIGASHDQHTLNKYPHPFFISEEEREWCLKGDGVEASWLVLPSVIVTRDSLFAAIEQVERLAEWIEGRMAIAEEWRLGRH